MADGRPIFDAHLDLACLAVNGRDMLAPLDRLTPDGAHRVGPWAPASITLRSLAEGDVRLVLATIFTETGGDGPEGYPDGDAEIAHRRGRAQMEAYLTWRDKREIALDLLDVLRDDPHVGKVRGGMGVGEAVPFDIDEKLARLGRRPPIHAGILIENADPIRDPDELAWWVERGVVAVGMAWWKPSRYATGNGNPPDSQEGLSDLGRALVRAMDSLGIVHDQSHLSDASTRDLFEATDAPVIASHSNCRALLGGTDNPQHQRHLDDETIREIDRRGGVIGLNLVRNFIRFPLAEDERPSIDDALAHVEHICGLVGHRHAVGLGTDMDGGISANDLPSGIDTPSDLGRLAEGLRDRGWNDEDVEGFVCGNWLRFWREVANRRNPGAHAAARAGA